MWIYVHRCRDQAGAEVKLKLWAAPCDLKNPVMHTAMCKTQKEAADYCHCQKSSCKPVLVQLIVDKPKRVAK